MKKKVLITGGAGFIGSNIVKKLNDLGNYEITILDKFNNFSRRLNGNYKFFGDYRNILNYNINIIPLDINDLIAVNKLLNESKFDIIFHQAAISDTTELDQEQVLQTNLKTFHTFLDYCKAFPKTKLVYASSAAVYGNTSSPQKVWNEESPENVYGFSKLSMDRLTEQYLNLNNNLNIVGLRYFNVYGPGEFYKRKTSSMILQLYMQALKNKSVNLFEHGEQLRDFVYIDDVVNSNLKAINSPSGIYNVGFGKSRSFNDIVTVLQDVLDFKIDINYIKNPYDFYQENTCADLNQSRSLLNYHPKYSLEDGISEYVKLLHNYSLKELNKIFNN